MKTLLYNYGLGDLAYVLFRPGVYFIDWVWGTDLRDCDKCKDRRKKWNAMFHAPLWLIIISLTVSAVIIGYMLS